MRFANFPLKVIILALCLASPAWCGPLINITGTGVTLGYVEVDCGNAATTTGVQVAAGATGGTLYNITAKNCTDIGLDADETVTVSNFYLHSNGDDIDVAAGKTLTTQGSNVIEDAVSSHGSGTYTDAGDASIWSGTVADIKNAGTFMAGKHDAAGARDACGRLLQPVSGRYIFQDPAAGGCQPLTLLQGLPSKVWDVFSKTWERP